jgi:secretion/DNA translocation related TadE-like protein
VIRRDQRGAATLLVLTFAGVLVLLAAAFAVVVAMVVAHRSAQAAADLAALAAAHSLAVGGNGCVSAADVAADNHAHLTGCTVVGRDVVVRVRVGGPHWLGQVADLDARARAGPQR